ncbi:hypothetical protein SAMN05216601_1012 [Ectopseudomonas composti]|uniref:Uncharacterized protein n=2 Tax=Ectopseudomonas composti TaxID=658457 RepID=A0A1I5J6C2_9GAMM|nr:hypothetical protein [Pseudomonas composti]SFO67936.1 hypothetical protein SAMN05216601_1012 [Pseudomonas composti]
MTTQAEGKPRELGLFDVIDSDGQVLGQSLADLRQLGYLVRILSPCMAHISHPMGYSGHVMCRGRPPQRDNSGNRQAANGMSAAASIRSDSSSPLPSIRSPVPVTVIPDSEYPSRPWR